MIETVAVATGEDDDLRGHVGDEGRPRRGATSVVWRYQNSSSAKHAAEQQAIFHGPFNIPRQQNDLLAGPDFKHAGSVVAAETRAGRMQYGKVDAVPVPA